MVAGVGEGLVGRDGELALLRELLAKVVAGTGGAVLVEGEQGIGKTELLRAGLAGAADLGCRVVWGTADELGDIGFGKSSAAFQYSWMSDDFYWTKDDNDWGYWYSDMADHPLYEPAYRYARDLITGLDHWYVGFIDWNAVLNRDGGPGHVVNPVPATIMVDTTDNSLYMSPNYYILRAFSQFIHPGAQVLTTTVTVASSVTATDYDGTPTQDGDAIIATAAQNSDGSTIVEVFNETNAAMRKSR